MWFECTKQRLINYFTKLEGEATGICYLWARTVHCPETGGKPVPLAPNWWLKKGSDPIAIRVIADSRSDRCRFQVIRGADACAKANPDKGTVRRGTAISPWTGSAIPGDYIKEQSRSKKMGLQLFAVGVKTPGDFRFRSPEPHDEEAAALASTDLERMRPSLEARGLIPEEHRHEGRADWSCKIYGLKTWADAYSPRQLLSLCIAEEELLKISELISQNENPDKQHRMPL